MACSARKEGVLDPRLSRIGIDARYNRSGELVVKGGVCNQCLACVSVCPCDAIKRSPYGLEYIAENCTDCGVCLEQCPNGQIRRRKTRDLLFCDGCDGDPECVKWCSRGALEVMEE